MERTRQVVGARPSRILRHLPVAILLIDVLTLAAVGSLALSTREALPFLTPAEGIHERLGLVGPLAIVAWVGLIALTGGYRRDVFGAGADEFKRVLNASMITAGLLGVGCYLAKYPFSRGFFLLAFALGPVLLLLCRFAVRRVLHRARRHGFLQVRVLVAGTPEHINEVSQVLTRENWLGYSVIGGVTPDAHLVEETSIGVPILGAARRLVDVATEHRADMIFFTGGSLTSAREMKELVWDLEKHRISVVIAPSLTDISQDRLTVRPVGGLPLIHVDHPTWASAGRLGKRLFDVIGSTVLILALSPVFALAAARIWLHDRGPLTFRHRRVGRHGEVFDCFKFRTMVVDAEALVERLQAETGQKALLFKMRDDPRITGPGKWLRRFSVDELPQLFNVLRGDMSLVGPRPQVQREVDLYDDGMSRRLLVRPGMTGLWQVSGRNDLTPAEAMRLDVFYVDNWSMLQDLSILVRTLGAVLGSRGAY